MTLFIGKYKLDVRNIFTIFKVRMYDMKLHVKPTDKIREFGETVTIKCPECGKDVSMKVLRTSMGVGMLGYSLFNYKYGLFTICPECHSIFSVDDETATREGVRKRGEPVSLTPENLTLSQKINLGE